MRSYNSEVMNPSKQDTAGRLIIALTIFYCASAACILYATYLAENKNQQNITTASAIVFFVAVGVTLAFLLRERGRAIDAAAALTDTAD